VQFLLGHSPEFRGHWAIQQRPTGELMPEVARTLLADELPSVRALGVAGSLTLRPADLWDYAREPAVVLRLAAVRHPRASDELLADRLTDPAPEVVAAAQAQREARAKAAAAARRAPVPPATGAATRAPEAPVAPRPAPKFIVRPTSGLFDKLKRVFWQ
jgi:hypothetical protein